MAKNLEKKLDNHKIQIPKFSFFACQKSIIRQCYIP